MKIDFEYTTKYGVYRDAIHLPDDHGLSDQQLEEMKLERLNNWLAILEAPPQEEVPLPSSPASTISIAGETYNLLEGTPPSGAKLIEVNGSWYYKV